jgi:hypothetical protein
VALGWEVSSPESMDQRYGARVCDGPQALHSDEPAGARSNVMPASSVVAEPTVEPGLMNNSLTNQHLGLLRGEQPGADPNVERQGDTEPAFTDNGVGESLCFSADPLMFPCCRIVML